MKTHKSQYGQDDIRVTDRCPTYAIRARLGRVHVGTPADAVQEMIRTAPGIRKDPRWSPALVDEAVRFALWQHRENGLEYRAVMSGSVGR